MKNSDLGPRREYKQGIVASLLDQLQARGCLVASLPDLADASGLSPLAVECCLGARVVKLVDTGDLKSPDPDTVVPVRFQSRAPRFITH